MTLYKENKSLLTAEDKAEVEAGERLGEKIIQLIQEEHIHHSVRPLHVMVAIAKVASTLNDPNGSVLFLLPRLINAFKEDVPDKSTSSQ